MGRARRSKLDLLHRHLDVKVRRRQEFEKMRYDASENVLNFAVRKAVFLSTTIDDIGVKLELYSAAPAPSLTTSKSKTALSIFMLCIFDDAL